MTRKAYLFTGMIALFVIGILLILAEFTYTQNEISNSQVSLLRSEFAIRYLKQGSYAFDSIALDSFSDATAKEISTYINSGPANTDLLCRSSGIILGNSSRQNWEGCCRFFCNGGVNQSTNPGTNQAGTVLTEVCTDLAGTVPAFSIFNSTLSSYVARAENQINSFLSVKGINIDFEYSISLPSICTVNGNERSFVISTSFSTTVNYNGISNKETSSSTHTIRLTSQESSRLIGGVNEYLDEVIIAVNSSQAAIFNQTLHIFTSYDSDPCSASAADYYPIASIASGAHCVTNANGN